MNSTKYSSMRNPQRQVHRLEVIPNRLYWCCSHIQLIKDEPYHVICTDSDFVYSPFFKDFGPLNLALIHKYIKTMNKLLSEESLKGVKIFHQTSADISRKTSAAFLMGCYMVIELGYSPENAWDRFQIAAGQFRPYRDPANDTCYEQNLLDCWKGLKKAYSLGWYNPQTFDARYYKSHSKAENGNFNVIVPNKFVAFNGPYYARVDLRGCRRNVVEDYTDKFKHLGITTIVRLNSKDYDEKKFIAKGFQHFDYYFPDGSAPKKDLIQEFLDKIEDIDGCIAVHCHAGLGRTATMIGAYVIKHYKMSASEFISWVRICRPGSVHGPQQLLLQNLCGGGGEEDAYQAFIAKNIYTKKNQNRMRRNTLKHLSTTPNQQQQPFNKSYKHSLASLPKTLALFQEIQSNKHQQQQSSDLTLSPQIISQMTSKTPQHQNKLSNGNDDENVNYFGGSDQMINKKQIHKQLGSLKNIFSRKSLHYPIQAQQPALPLLKQDKQNVLSTTTTTNRMDETNDNKKRKSIMYRKISIIATEYKENNNFFDTKLKIYKNPLTNSNHA